MNIIELVIEGPDDEVSLVIQTEFTKKEIQQAYKTGSTQLGFDIVVDYCYKFDDDGFPIDQMQKLIDKGFNYKGGTDCANYYPKPKDWFRMYCFIVKLGNPNFDYTMQKTNRIDIGGYGLSL